MINNISLKIFFALSELLYQSLTNPDKEYSSKKLTMLACLIFSMLLALLDQLTKYKLNENVFFSFMLMASGQSILNVISNHINKKIE